MRTATRWIATIALTGMCALPAAGQDNNAQTMHKAVSYPHAGVKIAVPEKFEHRIPSDHFTVLRATKRSGKKVILGVTLSAFPQGKKDVTADDIADAMTAEMGKSLAIRNLKLLKKAPMPVGDIKGTARLLSYTFRGKETTAARVFFMRKLETSAVKICYVLTVEAAQGRKAELVRTLGNVIRSVKLTPVQHPRDVKIASYQSAWKHYKLDFSVRPPKGWFAVETPAGVAMGQVDYLAQPVPAPSPAVSVVAVDMGKDTTCAELARKTRSHYRSEAASAERQCKMVASSKAKLAGVEGTQMVLWIGPKGEKTATTQPAEGASYEVVILRIACVPHPKKKDAVRAYTLVYNATNQPPADAATKLEAVAETFELIGETARTATTRPSADASDTDAETAEEPAEESAEE